MPMEAVLCDDSLFLLRKLPVTKQGGYKGDLFNIEIYISK